MYASCIQAIIVVECVGEEDALTKRNLHFALRGLLVRRHSEFLFR